MLGLGLGLFDGGRYCLLLYCFPSHSCFILSGLLLLVRCYYYSLNIFNASDVIFVAAGHSVGQMHPKSFVVEFVNDCEYTSSSTKCLHTMEILYFDGCVCLSCSVPCAFHGSLLAQLRYWYVFVFVPGPLSTFWG